MYQDQNQQDFNNQDYNNQEYNQENYNEQTYDEENQSYNNQTLNVEADKVIAMNPSGVIEHFDDNKKMNCTGDVCILDDNSNETVKSNYTSYIIYLIIFLVLCGLAFFLYKKYYCVA
jgi:hypothetical protein